MIAKKKAAPRRRTSPMTIVWAIVLGLSAVALLAGFQSGSASVASPQVRVAKSTAAIAPPETPYRMPLTRTLHGARSLADAGDLPPPPIDDAVSLDRARRTSQAHEPTLAIVVLDAAAGDSVVNQMMELPLPLTFSIDPSSDGAQELAARAIAVGRATLIQLAVPSGGGDLVKTLRRMPGAAGVDVETGPYERIGARSAKALVPALARTALPYVALRGVEGDAVAEAARERNLRALGRDIVIDGHDDEAYVRYMLHEAAELAFRYGDVVAIAHPYPETYAALRALGGRLAADGVVFAKISDLAR